MFLILGSKRFLITFMVLLLFLLSFCFHGFLNVRNILSSLTNNIVTVKHIDRGTGAFFKLYQKMQIIKWYLITISHSFSKCLQKRLKHWVERYVNKQKCQHRKIEWQQYFSKVTDTHLPNIFCLFSTRHLENVVLIAHLI